MFLSLLSRKQQKQFYLNILFICILNTFDLFSIGYLLYFLQSVFSPHQSSYLLQTIKHIIPNASHSHQLILIALLLLLTFLIKNILSYFIYRKYVNYAYDVAASLSQQKMQHYFLLGYEDYCASESGDQLRNITQIPVEFAHYVLLGAINIISELMLLIFVIGFIIFYNINAFLLLMFILAPCFILIYFIIRKRIKSVRETIQKKSPLSIQYALEATQSFVESKLYNKEAFFIERYGKIQQELNNELSSILSVHNIPNRLLEVFAVLGVIAIFLYQLSTDAINTETLMLLSLFTVSAYKAIPSLNKLMINISQIKTYRFTIDILKEKSDSNLTHDKTNSQILFNQSIKLKNVSFFYKGQIEPVFKNINMNIKKGTIIGINGASGNGKSTLIHLLIGLLNPEKGEILVDEIPVKNRMSLFSYVKQTPIILSASIQQNIVFNDEKIDTILLNKVINYSGLKNLLAKLPDGIHTHLDEQGKNISGGEQQRICIARALYQNKDIIILDESISEVEEAIADDIVKSLQQLTKEGKTIILISHQQHVFKYCDNLYTLTNGELVLQ
jgi:ABC-type multidrug transport system fused ATPase/permease subunit